MISPTLFKIFLDDLGEYLDKSRESKSVTSQSVICYSPMISSLYPKPHSVCRNILLASKCFVNTGKWSSICVKLKSAYSIRKIVTSDESANSIIKMNRGSWNYNVLGITFYAGARRFLSNYNRLQEKATRAIFLAKQLAYNKMGNQISFSELFKISDTQIQPNIDYGCEVW